MSVCLREWWTGS